MSSIFFIIRMYLEWSITIRILCWVPDTGEKYVFTFGSLIVCEQCEQREILLSSRVVHTRANTAVRRALTTRVSPPPPNGTSILLLIKRSPVSPGNKGPARHSTYVECSCTLFCTIIIEDIAAGLLCFNYVQLCSEVAGGKRPMPRTQERKGA